MRPWFLSFVFIVLFSAAGYLIYGRLRGGGGEAAAAGGSPAAPANVETKARAAGVEGASATLPAPSEGSAANVYDRAIAAAAAAAKSGDLSAQARALTRAIDAALAGADGTQAWAQAAPASEALAVVNDRLWFAPEVEFRSARVNSAALSKITNNLMKQNPPVNVGWGFLAKMNQLKDVNNVPAGRKLRVPADSLRITVRLRSRSLVLYLGDYAIQAFPVGVGRPSSPTPAGKFTIQEIQHLDKFKRDATKWTRPEDGKVFYYGDAEYPFGRRFLRFAAPHEHYGIHGTDTNDAIGAAVSHGCVRMLNSDVEYLASLLDVGAAPRTELAIE